MTIISMVNSVYYHFGIVFTIGAVDIEKRSSNDFRLTHSAKALLQDMNVYLRYQPMRNVGADCIHFLFGTYGYFQDLDVVGGAIQESMCSRGRCAGVTVDRGSSNYRDIAIKVAHQLGHNLGLTHDILEGDCGSCVMSNRISQGLNLKLVWSVQSSREIRELLEQGLERCLSARPKPTTNLKIGKCGNGIVDPGEECDCGLKGCVNTQCCDKISCKLTAGSNCATGACCNLATCQLKERGHSCRPKAGQCDLPEFCNGYSEYCPNDVYVRDGVPCKNHGISHCFNGDCQTYNSACRRLWGPTGTKADDVCFEFNKIGDKVAHCPVYPRYERKPTIDDKINRGNDINAKRCLKSDIMCGRLWCNHNNEKNMIYGAMAGVSKYEGTSYCAALVADLGSQLADPGLVPDGTPCGDDKMCHEGSCVSAERFKVHGNCTCNGRGVCNSKGNCHCNYGFKPPDCRLTGTGGSLDSGPPPLKSAMPPVIVVLIVLTLLFALTITFIVVVCVKRRDKLAAIKFRYRSVPSRKSTKSDGNVIEFENTNKPAAVLKVKVRSNTSADGVQRGPPPKPPPKPLRGPPKPPPKPNSLTIKIDSDIKPLPSPDTPPLPPFPNVIVVQNGMVPECTEKAKNRPKISSPIFQTSTNSALPNFPLVQNSGKRKERNQPSFVPKPPKPPPISNSQSPPPPPPPSNTKPPLPPPPNLKPSYRPS